MSTDLCGTVDVLSLAGQDGGHRDSQPAPEDAVYEFLQPGTLLHLFANSLVLSHTAPYLSASGIVNLAATCRSFRALIYGTPSMLRYLDMSTLASANFQLAPIDRGGETWRNVQLDENVTEDDFYSGPLRGTLNAIDRCGWLSSVHTLVLDNLAVTADVVHEILTQPQYNVRILSLRNTKHLNENQLCGALKYACRPSAGKASKLKGLYIFGGFKISHFDVCGVGRNPTNDVAGDVWYHRRGRVLPRELASSEWASTLMACRGSIAFDGLLCNGPHHYNSPAYGKVRETDSPRDGFPLFSSLAMASHALGGCAGCGSAPEGWTTWGDEQDPSSLGSLSTVASPYVSRYPLLHPPPLHTSNLRAAMCPDGEKVHPGRYGSTMRRSSSSSSSSSDGSVLGNWKNCGFGGWHSESAVPELSADAELTSEPARFIARCDWCVHDRLCYTCQRWWCEACMPTTYTAMASTTSATGASGSDSTSASSPEHAYKPLIGYSCLECGRSCADCIRRTQKRCKSCRNIYCSVHNDGSSDTHGAARKQPATSNAGTPYRPPSRLEPATTPGSIRQSTPQVWFDSLHRRACNCGCLKAPVKPFGLAASRPGEF